jgi:hypothetical protein
MPFRARALRTVKALRNRPAGLFCTGQLGQTAGRWDTGVGYSVSIDGAAAGSDCWTARGVGMASCDGLAAGYGDLNFGSLRRAGVLRMEYERLGARLELPVDTP